MTHTLTMELGEKFEAVFFAVHDSQQLTYLTIYTKISLAFGDASVYGIGA